MFHKTLQETTWQMDRNTVAIWTTAHLQYLLITVKVAFSDIQNPNTVCEYINCRWQALFAQKRQFNATNSDASISVRKIFFGFFFAFFKSILNFKHFPEKDDPHFWCISGNIDFGKRG